jgi:two-component system, chemotaxis family, sensor kinase CheA
MSESGERAKEEFFSEGQELVEVLSRSLLSLDEALADERDEPGLVNEAFRAVHTLKSLAGIFGAKALAALSHRLEDALDEVRLGRLLLTRELLDVLFHAVEMYWQLLAHEREPSGGAAPDVDGVLERLARIRPDNSSAKLEQQLDFDTSLLSVLTEYEEHRLRISVAAGLELFKVRVRFDLATIDKDLEEIKSKAKPLGEVITYLPTGEMASADAIELDLLMASGSGLEELTEVLGGANTSIEPILRRQGKAVQISIAPNNKLTPLPTATFPDTTQVLSAASVAAEIDAARNSLPIPAAKLGMRSVSRSVRVDIRKLDLLMNAVGELAIVKSALARIGEQVRADGDRRLGSELQRLQRSFDRRLLELQEGILEVRMVPLSQMFERLTRVVRQISRDVGKDIRFVVTGGETEIDKLIVEELSDPLMHIVRNAIDHGIEGVERRLSMGKPRAGTIALNAYQKGNHVVVEVEDDGGGVNAKFLVERAVSLGKLSMEDARQLTRKDVLALMFLPGLSTRDQANDFSGRGVGMDVVKTNIGRLGGVIDLESEVNIGTKITVTLPITLAIVSALLVHVAGRLYALPLNAVSEAMVLDHQAIRVVDGKEVQSLRGASLPLCYLRRLFRLSHAREPSKEFVVVATIGSRRLGLVVDELLGQQNIVIKALGATLCDVRGFSGATELGDQRLALVLDVASIIEEVLSGTESSLTRGALSVGRN